MNLSKLFILEEYKQIGVLQEVEGYKVETVYAHSGRLYVRKTVKKCGKVYHLLETLEHEFLPKIYYVADDFESSIPTCYIIEEYVSGSKLEDLLYVEKSLCRAEVKMLCLKLCRAINELHKKRIVHGNLNLSNIFILEHSIDFKLIDFEGNSYTTFYKSLNKDINDLLNIISCVAECYNEPWILGTIRNFARKHKYYDAHSLDELCDALVKAI